jgi:hypothetical protein
MVNALPICVIYRLYESQTYVPRFQPSTRWVLSYVGCWNGQDTKGCSHVFLFFLSPEINCTTILISNTEKCFPYSKLPIELNSKLCNMTTLIWSRVEILDATAGISVVGSCEIVSLEVIFPFTVARYHTVYRFPYSKLPIELNSKLCK